MDRGAVFGRLAEEAAKGDLVFPTHADVALRVRRALDDPDCSVDAAAKLIQAEPLLAARVVAMSNSVVYNRSGREVTDVRQAVARIGFRTIRSLATALAVRQMSGSPKDTHLREMSVKLWEHTSHVAALCHAVARHVTHHDAETALFTGIVHEVAGFYLLSRAGDFPGLLEGEREEWAIPWSERYEAEVGRAVLKVLAVPEPVVAAVEAYWQGYLALPPVSLGDTLLLAEELVPVESPLHPSGASVEGGRQASIEVSLGEETLSSILRESAAEVASLIAALKF